MQNVQSLSFEAIPSRFCDTGDYLDISDDASDNFSYFKGLSVAFTNDGCFIRRQHMNAIGRLGTTAQALLQAGWSVGWVSGISYGMYAAVTIFDGLYFYVWVSGADLNTDSPPGTGPYYKVMSTADVSDELPPETANWKLASAEIGASFFDVS